MCQRMCPLSYDEAQEVLESRERTGRAQVDADEGFDPARDAYPGSLVPAYVRGDSTAFACRVPGRSCLRGCARTGASPS